MTIHEQAKAARALANELFKGGCDRAQQAQPCLEKAENRDKNGNVKMGGLNRFASYDHENLCGSCRAFWYAEMAAQTLFERTAKLTPLKEG